MLLGKPRERFLKENFSALPKKELLRFIKEGLGRTNRSTLVKILVNMYSKRMFNPEMFKGGQND